MRLKTEEVREYIEKIQKIDKKRRRIVKRQFDGKIDKYEINDS